MPLTGQITAHFAWSEAFITEHRELLEANRNALAASLNLQAAVIGTCTRLLEPVRAHFGRPVMVHSMYRCPALNAAIGGSTTSQHMRGEACDFHVEGVPLWTVFDWIRLQSGIPYGQVILEGRIPSWVHLSLGEPWRPLERSREALTWDGERYSVVG